MTIGTKQNSLFRRSGYLPSVTGRQRESWKLRTQKLIDGTWVELAAFPTVTAPEHVQDQRSRLQRHALAFGGQVRLLRGCEVIRAWRDGVLEVPLSDEGEAA